MTDRPAPTRAPDTLMLVATDPDEWDLLKLSAATRDYTQAVATPHRSYFQAVSALIRDHVDAMRADPESAAAAVYAADDSEETRDERARGV